MKGKYSRWCQLVCASILLLLGAGGCAKTTKVADAEDVPVIRMEIAGMPELTGDYEEVNEKLGEISQAKYGFRLQIAAENASAGSDFAFYTDAKEGIDIKGFSYAKFKQYAEKGMLMDMSSYLPACGEELQRVLDEKTPVEKSLAGHVYGIPKTYSDIHYSGVRLASEYIDKYQMDVDEIHDLLDMEPLLEIIKEKEPEIIPWATVGSPTAISRNPIGDLLDGMLCMIDYSDDSLQVKNMYETEEYEERVRLVRRWYEQGYLQKDILTNKEYGQVLLEAGQAFASEVVIRPDEQEYKESVRGSSTKYVSFDRKPWIDTECDWIYVWCIAKNTRYPEEAVTALNAVYADRDILTTILYGIEGKHYVVREDGRIEYPEGVNEENVGYQNYHKWMFNRLNARLWKDMDDDIKEQMDSLKADAEISPAYGFWFDSGRVSVNLPQIQSVIDEYKDKLNCGVVDVDKTLPEFQRKLREAGSEQLVKEVQRQVDEWNKYRSQNEP